MRRNFVDMLACPHCRGELDLTGGSEAGFEIWQGELVCTLCGRRFPIVEGVPVVLTDHLLTAFRAYRLNNYGSYAEGSDVLTEEMQWWNGFYKPGGESDRAPVSVQGAIPGDAQALQEALADPYWAALKQGLRLLPSGWELKPVGAACCGRGTEFGFLASFAVRYIIGVDISLHGVRKAGDVAKDLGIEFDGIVADAARLPLRAGVISTIYAHEGLHHLPDPSEAIRELFRVASETVMFCEPADAALTRIAVRFGYSTAAEQSGARTYRFKRSEIGRCMQALRPRRWDWTRQFVITETCFAPDGSVRKRPVPPLLPAVNRLLGRWLGNKCVVVIYK